MYDYDRGYKTARAIYTWLEFVGWATVVLGAILVLYGLATGGIIGMMVRRRDLPFGLRLLSALPGMGTAIAGLFTVAYVQTSRAHVDTAETSREMLEIARRGHADSATSGDGRIASHRPHSPAPVNYPTTYRGHKIGLSGEFYQVGEKYFNTASDAEKYIESSFAAVDGSSNYSDAVKKSADAANEEHVKIHKGYVIRRSGETFITAGVKLANVLEAEAYIDRIT